MSILSEIFGNYPQVRILEAFVDHFEEELSIPDIMWLTDMTNIPDICEHIKILLDKNFILEYNKTEKTYRLNTEKQEMQLVISFVNNMVIDRLSKKIEERKKE